MRYYGKGVRLYRSWLFSPLAATMDRYRSI